MKLKSLTSNENKIRNVIITHGDLDGLTSAFWIIKYLENKKMNYELYTSLNPSMEETTRIINEEVGDRKIHNLYILDRSLMDQDKINIDIEYIVYIDHHQSNAEIEPVSITFDKIFDSSRYESASTLAKDYVLSLDRNILDLENTIIMNDFTTWVWLWDTFEFKHISDYIALTEEDSKMAQMLGKYQKESTLEEMLDDIMHFSELNTLIMKKIEEKASKFDIALQEAYDKFIPTISDTFICNDKCNHIGILKLDSKRFVTNIADKYFTENPQSLPVLFMHLPDGCCEIRVRSDYNFPAFEIASKIGSSCGFSGGGHPKAAGFKFAEKGVNDTLEFLNIITQHLK